MKVALTRLRVLPFLWPAVCTSDVINKADRLKQGMITHNIMRLRRKEDKKEDEEEEETKKIDR